LNNWSGASYNFENGDCYVVLTDSNNNIIDYSIVTTVNDGQKGDNGDKGDTPTLNSIEIVGYSLESNEDINTESNWKKNISDLTTSPGQTIYILNKYNWSTGTKKVVTSTLAGTQGIDGKSRVLFYLGSFETGKATLDESKTVNGELTDEKCDYYIDKNGQAWMRTGTDKDATANPNGYTSDNDKWKKSEKVGFLQAGAIHADMINAGSITTDSAIVTKLFSKDIVTEKLDVSDLSVTKLNTKPNKYIDKIEIINNDIKIFSKNDNDNTDSSIVSTYITSNKITSTNLDDLFDDWEDTDVTNEFHCIDFVTSSDEDFKYVNKEPITIDGRELGYLEAGGSVKFFFGYLAYFDVVMTEDGGLVDFDYLNNAHIKFVDDSWRIIFKKFNSNINDWEICEDLSFYIDKYDFVDSEGIEIKYDESSWGLMYDYTLTFKERGIYKYEVILYKIFTDIESNEEKRIAFWRGGNGEIQRNKFTTQYTEIGRNGAIFKAKGDTIFMVNENEIGMRVQNYGLKITDKGIFIRKPNKGWYELDV
jgi:hypothetical protein